MAGPLADKAFQVQQWHTLQAELVWQAAGNTAVRGRSQLFRDDQGDFTFFNERTGERNGVHHGVYERKNSILPVEQQKAEAQLGLGGPNALTRLLGAGPAELARATVIREMGVILEFDNGSGSQRLALSKLAVVK